MVRERNGGEKSKWDINWKKRKNLTIEQRAKTLEVAHVEEMCRVDAEVFNWAWFFRPKHWESKTDKGLG